MEYIYTLFGGVFLTNIFFSIYKIRSKKSFYEKLQYLIIIPVVLYLMYIMFFILQNLTMGYGLGLTLGIFGKIGIFLLIILLLLLMFYLQILMFRVTIILQGKGPLKSKIKKSLTIVGFSIFQGVALHITIWAIKAGKLM